MITRNKVLSQAAEECMKELYSFAQPCIKWETFISENKKYNNDCILWEEYDKVFHEREKFPEKWESLKELFPNWENKSITECIGPKPFEFYYLPKKIMKDICDSYVNAYRIDSQQELLNIIQILKNYCKEPIVDKYIDEYTDKNGNWHPGYRSYDHPDNLVKEVTKILTKYDDSMDLEQGEEIVNKFFEFLDMAGNFYNWNRDFDSFNISIYLGASPSSNKKTVIENWKKYRNQDIEIDEEKIINNFYEEEWY